MLKSESTEKLFAALVAAQNEMQAAKKNEENPFLKNKYADIGALIEAARPYLTKNQLAVTQLLSSEESRIGVTTLLVHSSGQWIGDVSFLPLGEERGKSLAQVAGSIITYLRRYGYAAILGMYAEEDDDGNSAPRTQQHKTEKTADGRAINKETGEVERPHTAVKTITDSQKTTLFKLYKEIWGGTEAEIDEALKTVFVSKFKHPAEEATTAEASTVINEMLTKIKEKKGESK